MDVFDLQKKGTKGRRSAPLPAYSEPIIRVGHFVDSVAVGNQVFVLQQIEQLRELGQYKRRKHPIEQMGGLYLSLSAQREAAS